MAKVFLQSLEQGYEAPIREGLAFTGVSGTLKSSDRVAIKPNLTFPVFRKGVMTNPEAIEALIRVLKDHTAHITICESDSGGYNPFSMDNVFESTGLTEIAKRYGVRVVNLTDLASRAIPVRASWRSLSVPLPACLLDETDLFISMPVPKVHANTQVSLALKNQWGIIQKPSLRLKLHPYFKDVIHAVNKALPRSIAVMDGRYGLTRNGPMRGDVVDLNWLMVADSLFWCDFAALQLMGISVASVAYLREIFQRERMDPADLIVNEGYERCPRTQFYLQRDWTDYPGLCTFHSRVLAYLGYESMLAAPLHRLLYLMRKPFY
jgi:uncharacterized protein (DUF362 family)